jgi:predicted transcriptional regulator
MPKKNMNISGIARELGVSTRTIRRYIKAGKIKAKLINGKFGAEYRIVKCPPELFQKKTLEEKTDTDQTGPVNSGKSIGQAMDMIRELQEKNLALAAQLGVATERVRNLENQVKLLSAVRYPWWKRIFSKKTIK